MSERISAVKLCTHPGTSFQERRRWALTPQGLGGAGRGEKGCQSPGALLAPLQPLHSTLEGPPNHVIFILTDPRLSTWLKTWAARPPPAVTPDSLEPRARLCQGQGQLRAGSLEGLESGPDCRTLGADLGKDSRRFLPKRAPGMPPGEFLE